MGKQAYSNKLKCYLDKYRKAFLVKCDNVGSKQFQDIRRAIRPSSAILMGKNTVIKCCLEDYMTERGPAAKKWEGLGRLLVGNVAIVFTEGDISDVRANVVKFKAGAPARV